MTNWRKYAIIQLQRYEAKNIPLHTKRKNMTTYKNILNQQQCYRCPSRTFCFLRRIPMQYYPENTQYFVKTIPSQAFTFDGTKRIWYANYHMILDQIITYYNSQPNFIQQNRLLVLMEDAQREIDKQFIRDRFKRLLEAAAKLTEETNPEASIVFDGIGLILASDYLEAVHKILSMINTYNKMSYANGDRCACISAYNPR